MAEIKYLSEHYDKKEYRGLEGYKTSAATLNSAKRSNLSRKKSSTK